MELMFKLHIRMGGLLYNTAQFMNNKDR